MDILATTIDTRMHRDVSRQKKNKRFSETNQLKSGKLAQTVFSTFHPLAPHSPTAMKQQWNDYNGFDCHYLYFHRTDEEDSDNDDDDIVFT